MQSNGQTWTTSLGSKHLSDWLVISHTMISIKINETKMKEMHCASISGYIMFSSKRFGTFRTFGRDVCFVNAIAWMHPLVSDQVDFLKKQWFAKLRWVLRLLYFTQNDSGRLLSDYDSHCETRFCARWSAWIKPLSHCVHLNWPITWMRSLVGGQVNFAWEWFATFWTLVRFLA